MRWLNFGGERGVVPRTGVVIARAAIEGADSVEAVLFLAACEGGGPGGGSNAWAVSAGVPNEGGGPGGGSNSCDGVAGLAASLITPPLGGIIRGVDGRDVDICTAGSTLRLGRG